MEKKLLVLVSDSDWDWGTLSAKPGWPGLFINYLDCETGRSCAPRPLSASPRLLCAVKRDASRVKNTDRIRQVIEDCHPWQQKVVGTHTRLDPPSSCLDPLMLGSIVSHNYSTASCEYNFVAEWCQRLQKPDPDPQEICDGYDRLFDLLSHRIEAWPRGDVFSQWRHALANVLRPLQTDIQGWKRSQSPAAYLKKIRPRFANMIPRIREVLYAASPSMIADVYAAVPPGPPQADAIRTRLAEMQALVPKSDSDPSASPLFRELLEFLAVLGDPAASLDRARQMAPSFERWCESFEASLQQLIDLVRRKAATSGTSS